MDPWQRVGIAGLLLVAAFGGFVHYDAAEAVHDPYVQNEKLVTEYGEHVGERTLLFGTVQTDREGLMQIEVDSEEGPFTMRVPSADVAVEPGGVVQVYGTLQPDQTIAPERIVVVNSAGSSERYKYGASAVGASLVVALFFRHWTIDTGEWCFEVRADG